MAKLLLFICCYPALSLAWCSSGVVGGGQALFHPYSNTIHHQHQPLQQFAKKRHHDTITLWSISNGGSQDDNNAVDDDTTNAIKSIANINDNDVDITTEKMTLAKFSKLLSTFWSMAYPYYQESQPGRRLFYGMILLTLINSGVSVAFSYISKDFWNALSSKDTQVSDIE